MNPQLLPFKIALKLESPRRRAIALLFFELSLSLDAAAQHGQLASSIRYS